jgi:hypothetical protein
LSKQAIARLSLDMLWVKTVAERMGDHVVSHHPTMPGVGKTAQAVDAAHRVEHSLHGIHDDNPRLPTQA